MANIGIILVALAALFWGVSGGLAGILISNGWDPLVVSFYRGAIGLFFMFGWLAFRPHNTGLHRTSAWGWSALAGLGIAGDFAFYFYSMSESSVAVASTLMYCAPVFVFILSFIFNLERPTKVKWGAMLLVLLGVIMLTRVYRIEDSDVTIAGAVAGLLSGMSLAIFIFGLRYGVYKSSPPATLTIAFTTLVLALAIVADKQQIVQAVNSPDRLLFLLLGVLGGGVAFILYLVGLKRTPPALAAVIATIEPVTASLFGVIVLNEMLVFSQTAGMGLILFTVTALGIYSARR